MNETDTFGGNPDVEEQPYTRTPTPWVANGCTIACDAENYDEVVANTAGEAIDAAFFSCCEGRAETNAEFIVKACNNYEAMLHALMAIVGCYYPKDPKPGVPDEVLAGLVNDAREVVEKAEGKQ